jgi:hypothetical protein
MSQTVRTLRLRRRVCGCQDPRTHPVALSHITDAQPDEVTGAQFAVDRQVKKCQFPCTIGLLKADPDRPNLFQLQRRSTNMTNSEENARII